MEGVLAGDSIHDDYQPYIEQIDYLASLVGSELFDLNSVERLSPSFKKINDAIINKIQADSAKVMDGDYEKLMEYNATRVQSPDTAIIQEECFNGIVLYFNNKIESYSDKIQAILDSQHPTSYSIADKTSDTSGDSVPPFPPKEYASPKVPEASSSSSAGERPSQPAETSPSAPQEYILPEFSSPAPTPPAAAIQGGAPGSLAAAPKEPAASGSAAAKPPLAPVPTPAGESRDPAPNPPAPAVANQGDSPESTGNAPVDAAPQPAAREPRSPLPETSGEKAVSQNPPPASNAADGVGGANPANVAEPRPPVATAPEGTRADPPKIAPPDAVAPPASAPSPSATSPEGQRPAPEPQVGAESGTKKEGAAADINGPYAPPPNAPEPPKPLYDPRYIDEKNRAEKLRKAEEIKQELERKQKERLDNEREEEERKRAEEARVRAAEERKREEKERAYREQLAQWENLGSDGRLALISKHNKIDEIRQPVLIIELASEFGPRDNIFSETKRNIGSAEITGKYKAELSYILELGVEKLHRVKACLGNSFWRDPLNLEITLHSANNGARNPNEGDKTISIKGTPNLAEGYEGKIKFIFYVNNNLDKIESHDLKLFIAPDPKSMWKDLEVADYEGYHTPNEVVSFAELPFLQKYVIAASCRGRSHANVSKPRDDYFKFESDPSSEWNVFAVSDGAGSSKYSRKGAEIVCETMVNEFLALFSSQEIVSFFANNEAFFAEWKGNFVALTKEGQYKQQNEFRQKHGLDALIYRIVYKAYANIFEEAKNKTASLGENVKIREYHATALFVAVKKFSFGYFLISFWIGDGGLALYNWNNTSRVLVLGAPDTGEYAGQTRFLTMQTEISEPLVAQRTHFVFADDFESIIMASDGVTDPFFPSDNSVVSRESWRELWEKTLPNGEGENKGCPEVFDPKATLEDKAKSLRRWLDFWSVGNHDDRTILIVK